MPGGHLDVSADLGNRRCQRFRPEILRGHPVLLHVLDQNFPLLGSVDELLHLCRDLAVLVFVHEQFRGCGCGRVADRDSQFAVKSLDLVCIGLFEMVLSIRCSVIAPVPAQGRKVTEAIFSPAVTSVPLASVKVRSAIAIRRAQDAPPPPVRRGRRAAKNRNQNGRTRKRRPPAATWLFPGPAVRHRPFSRCFEDPKHRQPPRVWPLPCR